MDLTAINRDPALRRTPLGRVTLRFIPGDDDIAVWVDDDIRPERWIDTLKRGDSVWDALGGKDFWSFKRVAEQRARALEQQRASAERARDDGRNDMARGLARILARPGGQDALIEWIRRHRAP